MKITEPLSPEFLALLDQLNDVVARCHEPVEGNLFYEHQDPDFPHAKIAVRFKGKRNNLIRSCLGRECILEIGVNAAHSALLLLAHTNIRYVGVDICEHAYTEPAIAFLKEQFPGRVEFFAGDSVTVLPMLHRTRPDLQFDVAHIDGLHTNYHCTQDVHNACNMMRPFSWMIIDDTDLPSIKTLYEQWIADGTLLRKTPTGWQPDDAHEIAMTGR